jgi:hypothetical protein
MFIVLAPCLRWSKGRQNGLNKFLVGDRRVESRSKLLRTEAAIAAASATVANAPPGTITIRNSCLLNASTAAIPSISPEHLSFYPSLHPNTSYPQFNPPDPVPKTSAKRTLPAYPPTHTHPSCKSPAPHRLPTHIPSPMLIALLTGKSSSASPAATSR